MIERTILLFLLEVTAKATLVVGVAALACWWLRRGSAALRHFIWAAALAGLLAMPALALLVPGWRVAVLPAALSPEVTSAPEPQTQPTGSLADLAREADPAFSLAGARPRARSAAARPSEATSTSPDSFTPSEPAAVETARLTRMPDRRMVSVLLLALWFAGAIAALARLLAGHAHLWWMERHADPITDPAWLELAGRVADQLRFVVRRAGGTARTSVVRLLRCRRQTMPVCWGVRRPSLLLPADADAWPAERRRIVLLHELAHAKRRDCLTQVLAQVAVAVHWFNPLVWLAVRHLRTERERACDDLVLVAGASAPDYADHLLDIARAFRTAGCPSWAAVAMARPSQLEGRLLAILDRHRDRRALTRPAGAVAAALALTMIVSLAAVQPAPLPADSDARASGQAVSKSRPSPTPAGTSDPTSAPVPAGEARPAPSPRPAIAPQPDPASGTELGDLELEIQDLVEVAEQSVAKIARADDRPEADPKIVAALVSALKDPNADVRRQAAATLSALRSPQALDALVTATTDADKDVREFAVHAISRHRSDAVTQALVRALKDNDPEVRRAAMHGVAGLRDPKYIDVFLDAFKGGDPEVRKLAVHTLSGFRDARAVPALETALKDADAEVRLTAILGIARQRNPQHVDVLAAALRDADAEVRQYAARALGQIGDARAADPLIAALKDTEPGVREAVVHALGQFGHRAGAKERR